MHNLGVRDWGGGGKCGFQGWDDAPGRRRGREARSTVTISAGVDFFAGAGCSFAGSDSCHTKSIITFPRPPQTFPRPPQTFPRPLQTFPRPPQTFPRPPQTFPRPPQTFLRPPQTFPKLISTQFLPCAWRPSSDDHRPWQVQLLPPSPPALSRCPWA